MLCLQQLPASQSECLHVSTNDGPGGSDENMLGCSCCCCDTRYYFYSEGASVKDVLKTANLVDIDAILSDMTSSQTSVMNNLTAQFTLRRVVLPWAAGPTLPNYCAS